MRPVSLGDRPNASGRIAPLISRAPIILPFAKPRNILLSPPRLNALSDIKLRTVLPASRLGLLLMSECTVLVLMAAGVDGIWRRAERRQVAVIELVRLNGGDVEECTAVRFQAGRPLRVENGFASNV